MKQRQPVSTKGSQFEKSSSTVTVQQAIGLPRTVNILKKWVSDNPKEISPRLRGTTDTQPAVQQNMEPQKTDPPVNIPNNPSVVSAVAMAPISKSEILGNLASSLHATRSSRMIGPKNLDSDNILISAWIRLDGESSNDHDMRTVFSNKKPGCESTPEQHGISMYINAWQTSDHLLYVEYGGRSSGCNKLSSGSVTLNPLTWYHVAAAFTPSATLLFIDGELVATSDSSTEPHEVQTEAPMMLGQYEGETKYPFFGNISNFVISKIAITADSPATQQSVRIMMQLKGISTMPGVVAHFPLVDAAGETPDSTASEVIHKNTGKYVFVSAGKSVAGVKIALKDGLTARAVTAEMTAASDKQALQRKEVIKGGMKRVWSAYKKYAWGRDELKPISRRGDDNWGGMGVTLVDSLDTLWLMGLKDEFKDAQNWVANHLTFDRAATVSVFETTIRELGGLLSAYDLSKEKVFLEKAKQLADKLMPAFNTPSGIPHGSINLQSGVASGGWSGNSAILSELGSLQLEFRYLGEQVGARNYEEKVMQAFKVMHSKGDGTGLYPVKISTSDGSFADNQITFGALGDSFYEYLLKVWIQGGKKEAWLRAMYDSAMNGAIDILLQESDSGLAFMSDWNGYSNARKMDHLVCFLPGVLALGSVTDPKGPDSVRAKRDMAVAKALMFTCKEMYSRQPTGISPEYVEFPKGRDMIVGPSAPFYLLRPETAESLFILHQLTGDPIYRDWSWDIWQAIDSHCRTEEAYGALQNVMNPHSGVDDRMESFFLGETMKYLYLAQDPDKPVDLMKMVFNTEAHPTTIFDPEQHAAVNL